MTYRYHSPEKLVYIPNPNLHGKDVKIAIYGTEKIGGITAHALEQKGIPFLAVDSDVRRHGKTWQGVTIISPQELAERHSDAIVLIASCSYIAIKSKLIELGLDTGQIYPCSHVLEGVDLRKCKLTFSEEFLFDSLNFYNDRVIHVLSKTNVWSIPRVLLMPTTECSLRCKDCNVYIPYLPFQHNSDKNQLIDSVRKLIDLGYEIDEVCISGGEPLLHPEISSVVDEVCGFSELKRVLLITNGTIMIQPELLAIIIKHRSKIRIRISNYGAVSKKTKEIIRLLARNNIYSIELMTEKWYKSPPIDCVLLPDDKVAENYHECTCNWPKSGHLYVHGNRYYPCSYARAFDDMGYELAKTEVVCSEDPNLAIVLERLRKREGFLEICRYCTRNTTKTNVRVPVAEQLP